MIFAVAPFAGAWIEIRNDKDICNGSNVAPFAGAWIEMTSEDWLRCTMRSLPSRERGLKFDGERVGFALFQRRSLYGSVD